MLDVMPRDAEAEGKEGLESTDHGEPSIDRKSREAIHPVGHPCDPVQGMDEFVDAKVAENKRKTDREG